MWIRNPGKSRAGAVLGLVLVLAILTAVPALGKPKGEGSPVAPAPAAPASEPEISFNGKVFCSLKRRVDLPFKGIITSILVHSGDRVTGRPGPGQIPPDPGSPNRHPPAPVAAGHL